MPHKFNPKNLQRIEYPERFSEEPFEDINRILKINQYHHIVDLGCGSGFHTFQIAHLTASDAKIYALDISEEMIDRLKLNMEEGIIFHLFAPADKNKIIPIKIEENQFPVPDSSIDLLFNVKLFHEIDSMPIFFKELSRILTEKGRIFTLDWKKVPTEKGPPIEHRIDFEDAKKIFKEHGYKISQTGELYQDFYFILAEKD
jgi:ubiquinone/menaquinone biosynthesis C-methylase UbiE